MLIISTTLFGCAFWFGLYLLNRSPGSAALRFAGLGLASYALGLAVNALAITTAVSDTLNPLLLLPAICWNAALLALLPAGRLRQFALATTVTATIVASVMLSPRCHSHST